MTLSKESKIKKVPCKECLLMPVCRHKTYMTLLSQCSIVLNYILQSQDYPMGRVRKEVADVLQPRLWGVNIGTKGWMITDTIYAKKRVLGKGCVYGD